jgi:hypothetical protein
MEVLQRTEAVSTKKTQGGIRIFCLLLALVADIAAGVGCHIVGEETWPLTATISFTAVLQQLRHHVNEKSKRPEHSTLTADPE